MFAQEMHLFSQSFGDRSKSLSIGNARFVATVLRQSRWLIFDCIHGDEDALFRAIDEDKTNLLEKFYTKSIYVQKGGTMSDRSKTWLETSIFFIFGHIIVNVQVQIGDEAVRIDLIIVLKIDIATDPTFQVVADRITEDGRIIAFLEEMKTKYKVDDLVVAEFYTKNDEIFALDQKILSVPHMSGQFQLYLIGRVVSRAAIDDYFGPLL